MSLTELDTRLEKWIAFHNPTLMGACIHALGLPKDIGRSKTHILRLKVVPRIDHGGSASKYFRVEEAEPLEVSKAMTYPAPWPESLTDLDALRREQAGRGAVAAVGVVCPPLTVQIVPFGSLKGLNELQIVRHWKETLFKDTQNGKKFTQFR